MATATEIVTKFSFEGSTQPLQQYNASLGKSIGLLGGMTAALGAAAGMMRKFTTDTLANQSAQVSMGIETQNSVQDIRELGFIAEQSGSSVQAMEGTLSSLSGQIRDAALNGSEDFARLGISIRDANGEIKNSSDVFLEARNRIQEMNLQTAEVQNLAEAIGIDSSLVRVLEMSNGEFNALRENARQYGEITEANRDTIFEYNNAQREMAFGMDSLKTLMAIGMAPTMQRLSTVIGDLIEAHHEWVVDAMQGAAEWIGKLIEMLVRLSPVIGVAIAAFVAWKGVLAGMAVWAAPALAIPALIAAGIVGLALVIDDLIVAFNGGESAIANFFESFFGWDIRPVLVDIVDIVKWAVGVIGDTIGDVFSVFQDLALALEGLFEGDFAKVGSALLSAFETIRDRIWAVFEGLFGWVKDTMGAIGGWLGLGGDDENPNAPESGRVGPGPMSIQPGFIQERQGGDTNNRVEQNIEVRVEGTDSEGAGRAVARAVQRQLRDADSHMRGGQR